MSFLYANLPAIYVAFVASLLAWLFGGSRGDLLAPVAPWLLVFMAEVVFVFPQKHAHESTYEARERVWKAMKKDPVVWTILGFLLLLLVPFVNNALCPGCDAALIAEGLSADPPLGFLPFCVNRHDHLNVVLWFALALSSVIAVRHALSSAGKRLVLEMILWNGAALGVFGFIQAASGAMAPFWTKAANGPYFFSSFGYPNMAASYFTLLFGIGVALWRNRRDEVAAEAKEDREHRVNERRGYFWRQNTLLIPTAICFVSALYTLSRAAVLMVCALGVVYFAHAFISILSHMNRAARIRRGVISLGVVAALVFVSIQLAPDDFRREVDTIDERGVLDRVTGKGESHSTRATALWKQHAIFGCGGWGYKHLGLTMIPKEKRRQYMGPGAANVHNDYLQFLTEHGLVGLSALVALVIILLTPVVRTWRVLVKTARFTKTGKRPPRPIQIFALPAPVFCLLAALTAVCLHAFGDCPLRSAAVLTLFFVTLTAAPGFLPNTPGEEDER